MKLASLDGLRPLDRRLYRLMESGIGGPTATRRLGLTEAQGNAAIARLYHRGWRRNNVPTRPRGNQPEGPSDAELTAAGRCRRCGLAEPHVCVTARDFATKGNP